MVLLAEPGLFMAHALSSNQRLYAEALLAFKIAIGNPQQLSSWVGRGPCLGPWTGFTCALQFKDSTIVSLKLTGLKLDGYISPNLQHLSSLVILWLDDDHLKGSIPSELGRLKNLTSLRLASNFLSKNLPATIAVLPRLKELILANNCLRGSLPLEGALSRIPHISLHGNDALHSRSRMFNLSACGPTLTFTSLTAGVCKLGKRRIAATIGGILNAPTLTPSQATNVGKSRKQRSTAIIGSVIGAVVLVGIVVSIVYFCLMRVKRTLSRISETGSSEPSPHGKGSPLASAMSPYEVRNLRQLTIMELEAATCNFSESSLIGEGGFGLVYRGLLEDGSIVAIKRLLCNPSRDFICEVEKLSRVKHGHILSLLGYCQGTHQQLLVYNYLPNGSVGNHLYNTEGCPIGKLDTRQRLCIALGAAKGLEYLHSLSPPLLHMHFKTSNVLLDENFTAKVVDFGLTALLIEGNRAGSSSGYDYFLDPELNRSNGFSETSDVYGFGVFLLELISGREALNRNNPESEQNLVAQAKSGLGFGFIDETVGESGKDSMGQLLKLALQCIENRERRPSMKRVVEEVEHILDRETGSQQVEVIIEEIGTVTLGSELFK